MNKVFPDDEIARTIKIGEPFMVQALNHTFEGALLYALISDDAPVLREAGDEMYLGSDEFWGEGHLMFAGDAASLRQFIAFGKTSEGRCASILVAALEDEFLKMLDHRNSPCSINMASIKGREGELAITIPEILQDMLIQYPQFCGEDHFTVTGHYVGETDPDHLGGYAFFVTKDEIKYQGTDSWLMEMRSEHRSNKAFRL